MANNTTETLIGAAVLAVAGGFLVYAANTADLKASGNGGYELIASFRKADGLNPGGDVRISGVKVGTINNISLDDKNYYANARLIVRDTIKIPEDSIAKIASDSLLGGTFVSIEPGASDTMLADGEEIVETQGSVNLMDLVSGFVHGSAE